MLTFWEINMKRKKKLKETGLPPGEFIYTGIYNLVPFTTKRISYNHNKITAVENENIKNFSNLPKDENHWINIIGMANKNKIAEFSKLFNIGDLTTEDILNVTQRTKLETFDNYNYIALKIIDFKSENEDFLIEQLSFIIKDNTLILYFEKENCIFANIEKRIKNKTNTFKSRNMNYLIYTIFDVIIDNYFEILDKISDKLEEIDERIMIKQSDVDLIKIKNLKQKTFVMKRHIFPLIEVLQSFISESNIEKENELFFKDLTDHVIKANELIELLFNTASNLMDLYLSLVSNKMNEIMKVLAMISTIFIPLSFIAGLYGMNFENMPELKTKYGYFVVVGIMSLLLLLMILYFKKKKWI